MTAVVPIAITARLLVRFAQTHVTGDRRTAIRRVVLHQAVTYGIVLAYVAVAVALWTRVLKVFA